MYANVIFVRMSLVRPGLLRFSLSILGHRKTARISRRIYSDLCVSFTSVKESRKERLYLYFFCLKAQLDYKCCESSPISYETVNPSSTSSFEDSPRNVTQ